jgi:hypothetical protein
MQAILRWISDKNIRFHAFLDSNTAAQELLRRDLNELYSSKNLEEFKHKLQSFRPAWKGPPGGTEFIEYMDNTWLFAHSRFPPELWSFHKHTQHDLDVTNNLIERYHREHINKKIQHNQRVSLKEGLEILHRIEKELRDDYINKIQNHPHIPITSGLKRRPTHSIATVPPRPTKRIRSIEDQNISINIQNDQIQQHIMPLQPQMPGFPSYYIPQPMPYTVQIPQYSSTPIPIIQTQAQQSSSNVIQGSIPNSTLISEH